MKNVTGTNSAVAIVAVNPGTAPTKRPNSDATSITRMLYGSKTRAKACAQAWLMAPSREARASPGPLHQHAPWERHPEQLVERVVNDQRGRHRNHQVVAQSHAEDGKECGEIDDSRGNEAKPIDQQNVEDVQADGERECEHVAERSEPRIGGEPRCANAFA